LNLGHKSALINAEAIFVETKKPAEVSAVIIIARAPGRDVFLFDYDVAQRIQEAYAKAGKELGAFISKKIK
jgi:hypothetical protein